MLINEDNLEEVISNIRTIHQTSLDQRKQNLTEYLREFFQSIEENDQLSCEQIFTQLHRLFNDYVDCAALKIEFLKGHFFETIDHLLIKQIHNQQNLISIFRFLAQILSNSENVQDKFLDYNGYEKIFRFLNHIHTPSKDFIDQLLLLMTEHPTTLPKDESLTSVDLFVHLKNPFITKRLVQWIPYLTQTNDCEHVIHSINIIVSRSLQNKMLACSNEIIHSLIDILFTKKIEEKILQDHIFSILEKLSRFSINTNEIRQIFQLFNENTSFKRQLLRVLITAAKNDDPDTQSISSYFDLQRPNSGIILPIIRRWPSLSSSSQHFTFHCWLRLNTELDNFPYDIRRQIYSFYSDSIGFEAFISHGSIYLSISDRRELAYIELTECEDLIDGAWHSLTIVHTAQRPSLFVAAFQAVSTCYLTIYIDGVLRRQVKDFKYVSLTNDPINVASVGAPCQRARLGMNHSKSDSLHLSTTIAKTIQPLKGLFGGKSKSSHLQQETQVLNAQNMVLVEPHRLDSLLGQSTCLYGQIACVWILAETLNESQVKHLHAMGPDFCQQFQIISIDENSLTSNIFDLLSNRSVAVYHPLACNSQICIDISACQSHMNGRLNNSSCYRLRPFSQSLLELGGCPLLYPLIDKFQSDDYQESSTEHQPSSPTNQIESSTDWIIVRKQSQKHLSDIDNRLQSNPIASIINLIRCVLSSNSMKILTEQMIKHYNVELLSQHLNRLSACFIDQHLLIAIQQLIECSRLTQTSNLLTNQLIQYILLDFSLWNKAKFSVRITHLQYISSVIKDERKYYRNKFGVQYFLDILKQYFNSSDDDQDEQKQLRSAIYGIIRYYIQRQIRIEELNEFLSTISTISTSSDCITQELVEFILGLIDPPSITTDVTIGLLCEPNMIECLYALLTVNNLSSQTKEYVFKIIKYLLASKRVPQQIKSQLRLETHQIGFGGIISGLSADELSVSIIREIMNMIIHSDSPVSVEQLNVVLTLCSSASLDVRYVAMRKIMSCFIANPIVCRSYAKCHGWQETLAHFFIKSRREVKHSISSSNILTDPKEPSVDSGRDSAGEINPQSVLLPLPPQVFEISSSPDDPTKEKLVRQLDLSPITNEQHSRIISTPKNSSTFSNSLLSTAAASLLPDSKDVTPEFLQRTNDDYQTQVMNMMTTPSTSREDLLSLNRTETSNDDATSITSNEMPTTAPATTTSIKHLYEPNEEKNEIQTRLRRILGFCF